MRKNYDLKKLDWKKNPYTKLLKKPITIRVDEDVVEYFKHMGEEEHVPYQSIINHFLRFCKKKKLKLQMEFGRS